MDARCPRTHRMALIDVLEKLPKEVRERMQAANEIKTRFLLTPSPKLNAALTTEQGIGLPYGRQTLIWGPKAAGKTTFCLQLIANAQKRGEVCVFIDAEKTFDPLWARRLGVDTEQLQVVQSVHRVDTLADTVVSLMHAGVDVIVVDSINALIPQTQYKDNELVGLQDSSNAMGQHARAMADAVPRMGAENKNTLLVLISQGRMSQSGGSNSPWVLAPVGGQATLYFSSTVIKLHSGSSAKALVEDTIISPSGTPFKDLIGRKVVWTVQHNKSGRPGQMGDYVLRFQDPVGVDSIGELIDIAAEKGILRKAGSWYYDDSDTFKNPDEAKGGWGSNAKIVKFAHENPEFVQFLEDGVYANA